MIFPFIQFVHMIKYFRDSNGIIILCKIKGEKCTYHTQHIDFDVDACDDRELEKRYEAHGAQEISNLIFFQSFFFCAKSLKFNDMLYVYVDQTRLLRLDNF